jgi:hypothetical protein
MLCWYVTFSHQLFSARLAVERAAQVKPHPTLTGRHGGRHSTRTHWQLQKTTKSVYNRVMMRQLMSLDVLSAFIA